MDRFVVVPIVEKFSAQLKLEGKVTDNFFCRVTQRPLKKRLGLMTTVSVHLIQMKYVLTVSLLTGLIVFFLFKWIQLICCRLSMKDQEGGSALLSHPVTIQVQKVRWMK